ncbi:hypothetical protein IAD21_05736 [Abditibacteriota bacterium]|nr:hypothetical protein IAD21_05736 [Abditibacteriota bacterium]
MTFSLHLSEYLEGWRIFGHSQNRLQGVLVGIFVSAACGTGLLAIFQHNWHIGIATVIWLAMSMIGLGVRYIQVAGFRRRFRGDTTPRFSIRFERDGVFLPLSHGEILVSWSELAKPLEGQNVWIFITRNHRRLVFIIPKRAIETTEGQREWIIVEEVFNPHTRPPIATPS